MVISDVRDGKFYWLLGEKDNSGKLCIYLNLVDSTTNSSLVVAKVTTNSFTQKIVWKVKRSGAKILNVTSATKIDFILKVWFYAWIQCICVGFIEIYAQ